MKTQRVITGLVILLFAVLVVGCGQKIAPVTGESDPSDAGSDLPATSITPPTGWSVYRGNTVSISFVYPPEWKVVELGNTVFITDTPLPSPLPPDLIGLPVTIGISVESDEAAIQDLRQDGTNVVASTIRIGDVSVAQLVYEIREPATGVYVLYRIPTTSESFIEVGVIQSWNNKPEIKQLLQSIKLEGV